MTHGGSVITPIREAAACSAAADNQADEFQIWRWRTSVVLAET